MLEVNKIYNMDCLEGLKLLSDNSVDLVVTSPPYNMRTRIRNGEYTTREKSEHFSKKYAHGAASDSSVHQLHLPWGMNPITDQYLSSCYFNFIPSHNILSLLIVYFSIRNL